MTSEQVHKVSDAIEGIFGAGTSYVLIVNGEEVEVATNARRERAELILEAGLEIVTDNEPEKALRTS